MIVHAQPPEHKPISPTRAILLHLGGPDSISFQLHHPIFLSGPAGHGKEKLQQLLAHWYLQCAANLCSNGPHPAYLIYEWEGAGKAFCTIHYEEKGQCFAFGLEGKAEEEWGKSEPLPAPEAWRLSLQQEGRRITTLWRGAEAWFDWLCGKTTESSAKKRGFLPPSPCLSLDLLSWLRYRPLPTQSAWQSLLVKEIHQAASFPDSWQERLLEYRRQRILLSRDEAAATNLPLFRKWALAGRELHQESVFLQSQFPKILSLHQAEKGQLLTRQQALDVPSAEQDALEACERRLAWLTWRIQESEQSVPPTSDANVSFDAPRLWWEARKLLQADLTALTQERIDALRKLVQPYDHEDQGEEILILSRLRSLEKELPQKLANIERARSLLDALRKEKEADHQAQLARQEGEFRLLTEQKEFLEQQVKEYQSELRRPKNTLRDWLTKNYPDWEAGPGKLLAAEVLESRGMFPALDRINDLFFGIRLHLEDLPGPTQAPSIEDALADATQALEAARKSLSEAQIHFQHEAKLLLARHRQKIRPLQRDLQQAEYDLQQWERLRKQHQQRLKQIQSLRRNQWEQERLPTRNRLLVLDRLIPELSQQIADLDLRWEAELLHPAGKNDVDASLRKLKKQWEKERASLAKIAVKAEKSLRAAQADLISESERWTKREEKWNLWVEEGLLPLTKPSATEAAALSTDQWSKRWELLLEEKKGWNLEGSQFRANYPWIHWEDLAQGEQDLEQLEAESLSARKAELASQWRPAFSGLLDDAQTWMLAMKRLDQRHQRWADTWRAWAQHHPWQEAEPRFAVCEQPLFRYLQSVQAFVSNHQHAVTGPSLFNHQDPRQTQQQTLHLWDNISEAWESWCQGMTRQTFPGLALPGLAHPEPDCEMLHQLYHLSRILSEPLTMSAPIAWTLPSHFPTELVSSILSSQQLPVVICSQWPLSVSGEHLWVSAESETGHWEALPFSIAGAR